jgi:hydroxymethylglutaryl-CoA synthase
VQPEYKQVLDKIKLLHKLNKRQKITFDVYEDLHEGKRKLDQSVIPPKEEFALNSIGATENDVGYRYYKYVE